MMYDLDNIPDNVLKRAWEIAEQLKPGKELIIKQHSKGHDKLLVECLKKYIDCHKVGEFNKDYTVFKKSLKSL